MHEQYYKIEKSPSVSVDFRITELPEVKLAISRANENYLSWEEFRKKDWASEKKESVWALIGLQREISAKKTPISDSSGKYSLFNLSILTLIYS